ncbi:hypothetical protein C8R46DRAFT_35908 [Mycena filopes]|nr:hypothetical protein C8R46DRAFT_35908 [Mycena filopes]
MDRVKRNEKRTERREQGQEGVSEDEPDELAPFLMVAPSGDKAGPPSTGAASFVAPENSNDLRSSTTLLFDDTVAEKNSFKANDNSIPDAIYSLARNGISPPLTLFLPTSLDRVRSGNAKTVKHGTGETTKVNVIDVSAFPDEETLSQATFVTCYNTFLTFVEGCAGARIFRGFAQHYNHILSADLKTWFPAYLAFDRQIRAQFFTKPYIIDIQDPEYRDALQSAKDSLLFSNFDNSPPDDDAASFGVSRSGRESRERPKPYDRDEGVHSVLCFRCGRMGHTAPRCSEADPNRFGRNFVIFANRDGLFRISDQRPVCMRYNCASCDASTTNSHALHICSLCADPHHGAVDCTRN